MDLEVVGTTKARLGGLTGQTLHYVDYITPDFNTKRPYLAPLHLRRYRHKSKGGDNGGLCFKFVDNFPVNNLTARKSGFALPSSLEMMKKINFPIGG